MLNVPHGKTSSWCRYSDNKHPTKSAVDKNTHCASNLHLHVQKNCFAFYFHSMETAFVVTSTFLRTRLSPKKNLCEALYNQHICRMLFSIQLNYLWTIKYHFPLFCMQPIALFLFFSCFEGFCQFSVKAFDENASIFNVSTSLPSRIQIIHFINY